LGEAARAEAARAEAPPINSGEIIRLAKRERVSIGYSGVILGFR
jgi:hypothetical protein